MAVGGGCSLILDFGEPGELLSDGGVVVDAGDQADAPPPTPDAGPADANAADCAQLEPNEDQASAQAITPGTITAAVCPSGDIDFYSFTVPAASDTTINITQPEPLSANLDLRLYDSTGAVITVASGDGASDQIAQTAANGNALAAGDYAVEVFAADGSSQSSYDLELVIAASP
jgi:hypothetical protein